jgi:cell volume regulation protein A
MAEVFHATGASPTRQDVSVDEGLVILLVGLVLAASLVVALGAARTGLPVLVAFLALGMLLGSEGPGGIEFDDAELARRVEWSVGPL